MIYVLLIYTLYMHTIIYIVYVTYKLTFIGSKRKLQLENCIDINGLVRTLCAV